MADTKVSEKTTKEPKKTVAKASVEKAEKKPVKTSEFAVIETGGKQYVVSVGDIVTIEKLLNDKGEEHKEGDKVVFDKVLLVDNGKDATTIGTPYIKGAKVTAKFEEAGKAKKLHVIRFKSKSRYFKKYGHRQPFNKVKIEALK